MKAIRIHNHGNIESLCVDDIPEPQTVKNKVKVQIKAAALNHLDIWVRNGLPGINIPLPLIMGSDASGIVVDVGDNVSKFKIGDKVVVQPGTVKDYNDNADRNINYSNTYGIVGETEDGVQAEYVNLPEYNLSMMPDHLTFEEASSMQLVFMTAYQMLVTRGCLKKHETILIYGATSGVGSAAIQIAKNLGANVITTVGTDNKKEYALSIGADYVLNHTQDIKKNVRSYTSSMGVDMVCEHIGEATWNQSLSLLKKGGRVVTCGSTTGANVSIDLRHLFMKQHTIIGSTMSCLDTFDKVMSKIRNKEYKPFIDKVFKFDDVKNAHMRLEDRKQFGKIVLVP